MKIVLAPDSFKGTFIAPQVCRALENGVRRVVPAAEILSLPLADGGEGTLDVLLQAVGGERKSCRSFDPLGRKIEVDFGLLPGTEALVEMARSSGLALLQAEERNPWIAGTYGLGLVIRAALDLKILALTVTLGGSATVDGGVGMARALGYRFLDSQGREIKREGGRVLSRISRIDRSQADSRLLSGLKSRALCDVRNPLLGPSGAARTFGPQKGADQAMVERLEEGLANLSLRVKEDLGLAVDKTPGSGAAGGLGAAVAAFLGGSLVSGIDYVLETLKFDRALEGADLVITGEGSFDSQSLGGKVISGVLGKSVKMGVPLVVVCGRWADSLDRPAESDDSGISGPLRVFSGADLALREKKEALVSLEDLSSLAGQAAAWFLRKRD
ncbi:MAG TPA: glycerate kinase [archaeon]|nr:glycerate kinase [archaeon]